MSLAKIGATIAALTVTTASAFAQAVDRASAPVADASQMGGSSTLLLILAVVLMGAGIYFLVDNDSNKPDSP